MCTGPVYVGRYVCVDVCVLVLVCVCVEGGGVQEYMCVCRGGRCAGVHVCV